MTIIHLDEIERIHIILTNSTRNASGSFKRTITGQFFKNPMLKC